MPFNPGPITPDRSAELFLSGRQALAQGIGQFGQSMGAGVQNYLARMEQTKEADAQAKAWEKVIRANPSAFGLNTGTPEGEDELEALVTQHADESAIQLKSRLEQFAKGTMTAMSLKEQQQQAAERQQQAQMNKAKFDAWQVEQANRNAALQRVQQADQFSTPTQTPDVRSVGPMAATPRAVGGPASLGQFMRPANVGAQVLSDQGFSRQAQQADSPVLQFSREVFNATGSLPSEKDVAEFIGKMAKPERSLRRINVGGIDVLDTGTGQPIVIPPAKGDEQQKFKNASELRNSFYGLAPVKEWQTVDNYYTRGLSLSGDNTGASDIGLIFSYMKVLDPTSVVREGEYATAQNSGSLPQNIINQYNKLLEGTKLTPEQRTNFVSTMKTSAKTQYEKLKPIINQYEEIAKDGDLKPESVIPPSYRNWSVDRKPASSIKILSVK